MRNLLVTLALISAIGASTAHGDPPLADRLPPDAIAYVGWAGRTHAFDGSQLGQLLEKAQLTQAIGGIHEALMSGAPDETNRQQRGRLLSMLSIAARHQMAVCVVAAGTEPAAGARIPGIAVVADLGKDRLAFDEHLQALLASIADTAEITDVTLGPIAYKSMPVGPMGSTLAAGYIDDMAFITLGAEMPAKLIALRDAADRSLLNAAEFAAAYKDVMGENEQLSVYLNLPKLMQCFRMIDAGGADRLAHRFEVAGLAKATAYVSAVRVVDRGLYRKTRVLTPGPHRGVLALMAGKSMDRKDLAVSPPDACGAIAWRIDPAHARGEVLWSLAKLNPHTVESVGKAAADIDQLLGVDLQSCLGERGMIVYAPSLGGLLTGAAVVVELADPDALTSSLDKLYAAADSQIDARPIRTVQVGQTTVGYLARGGSGSMATPAWAIHNGKLIVAGWPQVVIAMIEHEAKPGLDATPAFQAAWDHLADPPSAAAYVNVPVVMRHTYGLWLTGWSRAVEALSSRGSGESVLWLPSLAALDSHLRPTISGFAANDEGVGAESFGTIPSLVADPLLVSLAAGELLGRLVAMDAGGRQRESLEHLRGIGGALSTYEKTHDGARPTDLQTLATEGLIDVDMLGEIGPHVYFAVPANAGSHLILIYEDPAARDEGQTAVLFADRSVATMPVDKRFWDLVEMSKAAATAHAADERP